MGEPLGEGTDLTSSILRSKKVVRSLITTDHSWALFWGFSSTPHHPLCLPPRSPKASVGLIALWQALFGGLNVDWAECDRRYRVVDLEGGEVVADGGGQEDAAGCVGSEALANEYTGGFLLQVVFASCIWMFWIAFIASTLGHAPKKVRGLRPFARPTDHAKFFVRHPKPKTSVRCADIPFNTYVELG